MKQLIEWFFRNDAPENSRGQKVNLQNDGEPDESFWRTMFASLLNFKETSHRAKQKTGPETNAELVGHVQIHTDTQAKAYESGLDETPTKETTRVVHAAQLPESNENPELLTLPGIENNDDAPEIETSTIEVTVDPAQDKRNNFLFRIHPGFFTWLGNIVTNIDLLNLTIYGPGGPNNPGGGSVGSYLNPDPMPEKVGGWEAGSTFDPAKSTQEMWDGLLYPYQVPEIAITLGSLFKTFEVGEALPVSNTVNYTVSNIGNIAAPNDGNLASTVGAAIFPVNPITLAAAGTFDVNFPAATTETAPASREVTLTGLDTQAGTPVGTGTILFRHKRYWGTHPSFTNPSDGQIIAADGGSSGPGNEFSQSRLQTRNGFNGGGDYLFFAWPTSFGTPSFKVNGLANSAWTKIRDNAAFINASGFSEPYDVWISDTAQGSPLNVEVE